MELRDLLFKILNEYPIDLHAVTFKENEVAKLLRQGFNTVPEKEKLLINKFKFRGSAGQGNWAIVPWIGIFSSESVTAQKGIYLVYLFSADRKYVYLSLNQGWKYFRNKYKSKENAKRHIINKATKLRKNISYANPQISAKPIHLGSKNENPIGYESGNILSIKYAKDQMPNNKQLIDDLQDMINLLDDILSKLEFQNDGSYNLKSSTESLQYWSGKNHNKTRNDNLKHKKISKLDYLSINRKKIQNGDYGEEIVLAMEKQKLIELGRPDLANKVQHSSKEIGDGLGYDIQSFDKNGNSIYIEVKSTDKNNDRKFNITCNELAASKKFGIRYRLYRLYNINKEQVDYYIISGDLRNQLTLMATSYRAEPKFLNQEHMYRKR